MIVVVCEIELFIPEANSLKSKRHVVKSVVERIKSRCNASVAETEYQNLWQRAAIGVALVGTDRALLDRQLDIIRRIIDDNAEAELTSFVVDYD